MSVKLVRANSDTPNIQNSDDCRLFRYACGGYDGIVKGYGNELAYEISGSNFNIKSGEFVIDGWQGKNDGNGITIQVDNLGGIQYYVVYAEIDLSVSSNQKAEIKATYNTAYYPTISRGDDLTTTPSGVARIELYRFEASSGVISNVQKRFRTIDYGWTINSENAQNLTGTIESQVLAITQAITDNSRKVATTEFINNFFNNKIQRIQGGNNSVTTENPNAHLWTSYKIGSLRILYGWVNLKSNKSFTINYGQSLFSNTNYLTSVVTSSFISGSYIERNAIITNSNTNSITIKNPSSTNVWANFIVLGDSV